MEDHLANEIAAQSMLTNQIVLQAIQYLLLLVAGSIALVTAAALLIVVFGLLWRSLQNAPVAQPSPSTAPFNQTTRRFAMKKIVTTTLLLCSALLATAIAAQAQTQERAVTNGPVCRIAEYRIKPGKGQEHMKFLREHRVQILNEVQFVEAVCYRDYNDALDSGSNEELVKKLRAIVEKHYGSLENASKAGEQFQATRDLVRGYVLHEMTIHPLKPAATPSN